MHYKIIYIFQYIEIMRFIFVAYIFHVRKTENFVCLHIQLKKQFSTNVGIVIPQALVTLTRNYLLVYKVDWYM